MNARRRALLNSWRRVSSVRYEGSDGVLAYAVERIGDSERPWRVLVDGAELVSESHRAPRRFGGVEMACWGAEEHAERLDDASAVAAATPRQGAFSWSARAERRAKGAT